MRFQLMFLVMFTGLVLAFGCGEDPVTKPAPVKPDVWTPLNLSVDWLYQLLYSEGSLYAAAGHDGIFVQTPAFLGDWTPLGLGFPETQGTTTSNGATAVAIVDGALFGAVFLGSGHILPTIYRFDPTDSTWTAMNTGGSAVDIWALATTETGNLLAATKQSGLQLSEDQGLTWQQVWGGLEGRVPLATFYVEPGEVLLGGSTIISSPFLVRSTDEGRSWQVVDMQGGLPGADGGVGSISKRHTTPPELFITISSFVLVSTDAGTTFRTVLQGEVGFSAMVFVNSCDEDKVVVLSDSLYLSDDGATTWRTFSSPRAERLRIGGPHWERGYLALAEWPLLERKEIYCFNLQAASAAEQ